MGINCIVSVIEYMKTYKELNRAIKLKNYAEQ